MTWPGTPPHLPIPIPLLPPRPPPWAPCPLAVTSRRCHRDNDRVARGGAEEVLNNAQIGATKWCGFLWAGGGEILPSPPPPPPPGVTHMGSPPGPDVSPPPARAPLITRRGPGGGEDVPPPQGHSAVTSGCEVTQRPQSWGGGVWEGGGDGDMKSYGAGERGSPPPIWGLGSPVQCRFGAAALKFGTAFEVGRTKFGVKTTPLPTPHTNTRGRGAELNPHSIYWGLPPRPPQSPSSNTTTPFKRKSRFPSKSPI